jgi:hypothetical protein
MITRRAALSHFAASEEAVAVVRGLKLQQRWALGWREANCSVFIGIFCFIRSLIQRKPLIGCIGIGGSPLKTQRDSAVVHFKILSKFNDSHTA